MSKFKLENSSVRPRSQQTALPERVFPLGVLQEMPRGFGTPVKSGKIGSLHWVSGNSTSPLSNLSWSKVNFQERRVVTRRPYRMVGMIPAPWKADSPIEHESQLEADFIKQALLVPGLVNIQSQPFTFVFSEQARAELGRTSYTPDFLLGFCDGPVLVEVRHSSRVGKDLPFFTEFAELVNPLGISFSVLTEQTIQRNSQRVSNAGLIYRYSRFSGDLIGACWSRSEMVAWGQLLDFFDGVEPDALGFLGRSGWDWDINFQLMSASLLIPREREAGREHFYVARWFGI